MSHLNLETLARLVDDAPDTAEIAHLSSCAECRTQLDAMKEDVHALAMLPDMSAAPDQWDALERRLVDEGLIRTRPRFGGTARMMQIAAALVLFAGGATAGRMTAQNVTAPLAVDTSRDTGDNPVAGRESPQPQPQPEPELASTSGSAQPEPDPEPMIEREPQYGPRGSVSLASNGGLPRPRSVDEAAEYLRATEAMYLDALTGFAELASNAEAGDPVARLAALQSIIMTTQAALNETPTDPVINGYHLTALAQRDATLRQVAQTSSQQWH